MTIKKISQHDAAHEWPTKPKLRKAKQKQERWIKNALRSNNVDTFYEEDGGDMHDEEPGLDFEPDEEDEEYGPPGEYH